MGVEDAKQAYHRRRLQLRRKVRRQKKQVEEIATTADDSLNKLVFKRFARLYRVRRFVLAWSAFLLLIGIGSIWQVRSLDGYFLRLAPAPGGIYREGIIGEFTTANPLFAVNSVDVSVSKLVFSGLFRINPEGQLEPDLATGYSVNKDGDSYTVKLRNDVYWHDGEKFNADDVVYTYSQIQNVLTSSPLRPSWKGVQISKINDDTVVFKLPNSLVSFKYSLINGIVPEHLLNSVDPADLRSSTFNTVSPVGTGPFRYEKVEVIGTNIDTRQEKITLKTNEDFYKSSALIDGIVIRSYRNEQMLLDDFKKKEISAMVGIQSIPDDVAGDDTVTSFSAPITSSVMLFLNNSSKLLRDKPVRQALIYAIDDDSLRERIGYQLLGVDSPFLKSHFAYDPNITQLQYNPVKAAKLLEQDGWEKNEAGVLTKNNKQLSLRLISQSLPSYAEIAQGVQEQWAKIGVAVDAVLLPKNDIQADALISHDYDVLLYGISIGPDPDVFAYWHSSQNDPRLRARLNFSEYEKDVVDQALESGRTRQDEKLRKIKYKPFLEAWREDAPAVALYQPRFLLVVRGLLDGYTPQQINNAADRFYSVTEWRIRRDRTIK